MLQLDLRNQRVQVEDLLLDPNNPRFFDIEDWEKVPDNLFHLDKVQDRSFYILESTQVGRIEELKKSIKNNGYIPTELIVVRPYEEVDDKYIIIEGNRRLTAIRSIIQDSLDPENDPLVQSLKELDVLIYNSSGDEEQDSLNHMILQGIRHIGGPKEWGAYQKANLIVKLFDERNLSWSDIGDKLGLSAIQTGRFYRAYKALNQMREDDEFSSRAKLNLFSLFDEAIKKPTLREWLEWSDENWKFNDETKTKVFYSLIVGDPEDDREPVITNPPNMRVFSNIVGSGNTNVLSRFLEGEISLDKAMRLIEPETIDISLEDSTNSYLNSLSKFPASKLDEIEVEEIDLLRKVIEEVESLIQLYDKLKN